MGAAGGEGQAGEGTSSPIWRGHCAQSRQPGRVLVSWPAHPQARPELQVTCSSGPRPSLWGLGHTQRGQRGHCPNSVSSRSPPPQFHSLPGRNHWRLNIATPASPPRGSGPVVGCQDGLAGFPAGGRADGGRGQSGGEAWPAPCCYTPRPSQGPLPTGESLLPSPTEAGMGWARMGTDGRAKVQSRCSSPGSRHWAPPAGLVAPGVSWLWPHPPTSASIVTWPPRCLSLGGSLHSGLGPPDSSLASCLLESTCKDPISK